MAGSSRLGQLQFCVEVKIPGEQTSLAAHRETLATCQHLETLFRKHRIRPSWAIHGPLMNAVQNTLGETGVLATLATTEPELAQFLEAETDAQRDETPAILVARFEPSLLQLAQLAAVGTRVVTLSVDHRQRATRTLTRYGLCLVRVTGKLPGNGSLLGRWDGAYQAKSRMHRAVMRQSTEVLTIRVDQLQDTSNSLRAIEKALMLASRLQSAGRIACETLLNVRDRMCPTSGTPRGRSILRAA